MQGMLAEGSPGVCVCVLCVYMGLYRCSGSVRVDPFVPSTLLRQGCDCCCGPVYVNLQEVKASTFGDTPRGRQGQTMLASTPTGVQLPARGQGGRSSVACGDSAQSRRFRHHFDPKRG